MAQAEDRGFGPPGLTLATREEQLDGKNLNAKEFYADESGGAYDGEESEVERIEKVYR